MAVIRVVVHIPVQPWFVDHRFDSQVILPAVEIMAVLAQVARQHAPALDLCWLTEARFDRLLTIAPGQETIEATVELEENGSDLAMRLLTRKQMATMSRLVVHCALRFGKCCATVPDATISPLTGPVLPLDTAQMYEELVPFGPAYRSLQGKVWIGREGADGVLHAPLLPDNTASESILGSPFPLDGAMHAACVHGQRLAGFVPFPVGFAWRHIIAPTEPGKRYHTQVRLRSQSPDMVIYDVVITDDTKTVRELITGLRMRDVSGGRIKPPEWIRAEVG